MLCPHCPRQVMTHLKKPQKDARLSRQAKEHLYNQAAQGQLRGRKGMKTQSIRTYPPNPISAKTRSLKLVLVQKC